MAASSPWASQIKDAEKYGFTDMSAYGRSIKEDAEVLARDKALEPKVRVSEIGANGLAPGDEVAIAGLEGDELPPESPRATSRSRPGTAPPTGRSAASSPRGSSHLLHSFNSCTLLPHCTAL